MTKTLDFILVFMFWNIDMNGIARFE